MNSVGVEVVGMSVLMFVITFGFGHLPSKIPASRRLMNLISIFGAGLLVGAALIVVVPEGMLVVFKSLSKPGINKE
jgi:zinc transporter 9